MTNESIVMAGLVLQLDRVEAGRPLVNPPTGLSWVPLGSTWGSFIQGLCRISPQ